MAINSKLREKLITLVTSTAWSKHKVRLKHPNQSNRRLKSRDEGGTFKYNVIQNVKINISVMSMDFKLL